MTTRVVILGAGTGGTLLANRLHKELPDADILVVDADDRHVYQPALLFIPFGLTTADDIVRPRGRQLKRGIRFQVTAVDRVDLEAKQVHLADGSMAGYDVLVVASGVRLVPEETEGLTGPGWMDRVFSFYDLDGATALGEALSSFAGGRLVLNIVDMPIKCPVAPLEFAFLADWYFHERGIRDEVELVYVTPLDGAFTKPTASKVLGGMLTDRGIEVVPEFNTGEIDGVGGTITSFDDREISFDLAVVVPAHSGADYVGRSPGLGDALDFIPTDPRTLQSTVDPDVFAIGDAAGLPTSKAGSVAHFEGEVLADNILRHLRGEPPKAGYDGHANCFIETGFRKAMLIDFNYDTEPVPGRYPNAAGLPLLRETRLNHLGKLMFQWLYWHVLLPGRDLPGIASEMPLAGKKAGKKLTDQLSSDEQPTGS
jgi:sulfide:quinone oxidoreductase